MSISISQDFHRTSANPVDDTLVLTKAQMLAINDNLMPDVYIAVCKDDGFIYVYDKSATPDAQTGKFTKYETGSQVDTSKLYSTDDATETNLADGDYFPFYDVSAGGKRKLTWLNYKTKMTDYVADRYQKILVATIGVVVQDDGTIYVPSMKYTTDEQVVGNYLGSTLYKKTFTGTLSSSTGATTVTSFSYRIVKYEGCAYNSSWNVPIAATAGGGSSSMSIAPYIQSGVLKIANTNSAITGATYNLTIWYVK